MKTWLYILAPALLALAVGYGAGRHAATTAASATTAPEKTADATATAPNAAGAGQGFNPDFVKTVLPQSRSVPDTIAVTGKLALDRQRVHIAAARVAGRLGRVFVFEGESVKAGQPLAEVYSPDFISAENEYLLARHFRDTLAQGGSGSTDAALRDDAAETFRAATNRLKVLGAADADIASLDRSGQAEQYLLVRAPIGGVVIQRNVDAGGYLNIGDSLMTVADTSTLWLYFNSYDSDYAALRLGQPLDFQSSSLPGRSFSGRVSFIAPTIDPATHTLPVRCDIPNPDMLLRPEMFVSGKLGTGERAALVVPRSAVIRVRDQDYVFVQQNGKQYRRLPVQGHALDDAEYAVVAGLDAATPVVSEGAVLLNQVSGS
jgi:membrane fusion protein, copper/silver efflux system